MSASKPRTLFEKIWDSHVVEKLPDGTCQLHYELWMQNGHGKSFSGPLEARGAGSLEELAISCDKIDAAAAAKATPAKAAPAKKK